MTKTLSFTHKSLELSLLVAEKEYDQICIFEESYGMRGTGQIVIWGRRMKLFFNLKHGYLG